MSSLVRKAALGAALTGSSIMVKIYTLQDLFDRKEKNEELNRYRKELEKLNNKLFKIRSEVALTEQIIKMVEKEEIVEFKREAEEASTPRNGDAEQEA